MFKRMQGGNPEVYGARYAGKIALGHASNFLRAGLQIGVLISALSFLSACGQAQESQYSYQSLINNCSALPANQTGSFMAPLPSTPVNITLDSRFDDSSSASPYILNAFQVGVQQWNTYGQSIGQQQFFSYKIQDMPADLQTPESISCDMNLGDSTDFNIVRVDDMTQWNNLGFTDNIPGATIRCYTNGALSQQIIVVNPELISQNQLPVVFTHELGHSIGLQHSCENGTGSSDYVGCEGLSENDPDYTAVMYPVILASYDALSPQPILQSNDEIRAGCLYQPGQ